MVEADAPIGAGDRFIAKRLPAGSIIAVNKVDRADRRQVLDHLAAAAQELGVEGAEYFPISALTGDGVAELVEHLVEAMPVGPRYFPPGVVSDAPEAFFVAELVREQLLQHAEEELPHSIACRVTEWEWPRIRCEILVERDSQKGIVIGRGGSVLKAAGTAVREQLAPGRLSRALREGGEVLAAPPRADRAPRLLNGHPSRGSDLRTAEPRAPVPPHAGSLVRIASRKATASARSFVRRIGGSVRTR